MLLASVLLQFLTFQMSDTETKPWWTEIFTPVSICLKDYLFSHVAPSQDKDNGCELCLRPLQDVQGFGQAVTGPGFGPFVSDLALLNYVPFVLFKGPYQPIRPIKPTFSFFFFLPRILL